MKAERERIAKQYRAEGMEESAKIMAETERERTNTGSAAAWLPRTAEKYLLHAVPRDEPSCLFPTNIEIEDYIPLQKTGIGLTGYSCFFDPQ